MDRYARLATESQQTYGVISRRRLIEAGVSSSAASNSPALVLILMARSVPYLLEEGMIKATVLVNFADIIGSENMAAESVAVFMYFFQMLLNLFVPGGTSQAMLTVPILIDLDPRLSAQVVVLVFHCGDGFSNLIWPTNPLLMVALGLAGVRYREWLRFILPLQFGLLVISILFIFFAVRLGYGF